MGRAKDEMMRREGLLDTAKDLLVEVGAAHRCPHGEVLSKGDGDAERRAYAVGTNRIKAGEIDGTREEFMEAIQSAMLDSNGECPSCRKIEEE